MGDLTIVSGYMCSQNDYWQSAVVGTTGNDYIVTFERADPSREVGHDFSCTCGDFKHRLKGKPGMYCKHILAVKNEKCSWHTQFHGGKPKDIDGKLVCPDCGSPVIPIRYGV